MKINKLIDILNNTEERYSYFVRFIDAFFDMHEEHQTALLSWIVEDVGTTKWEKLSQDVYRYPSLVRMILYHYSSIDSSSHSKDPSPTDLAVLISEYKNSVNFKEVDARVGGDNYKEEFLTTMEL